MMQVDILQNNNNNNKNHYILNAWDGYACVHTKQLYSLQKRAMKNDQCQLLIIMILTGIN